MWEVTAAPSMNAKCKLDQKLKKEIWTQRNNVLSANPTAMEKKKYDKSSAIDNELIVSFLRQTQNKIAKCVK